MDTRVIGIITKPARLFGSGLVQNAYFLYDVYRHLGHVCTLLSYDSSYTTFEFEKIPIRTISDDEAVFKVSDYKALITVAMGVTPALYKKCKDHGVRVIGFLCGNSLMMHLEDFRMSSPSNTVIGKEHPVDELWLLESFAFMKSYVELLRGAPARTVPHLWSPRLLENTVVEQQKKPTSSLVYNPVLHSGSQIELLILEPNINIVKTALIPLMASERVFLDAKDLINEVYVFNYPTENKNVEAIVSNLNVKSKLRKFKNLPISEILTHFNAKNTMPVFVCHQLYNEWNYLYYELMYFGYPFVHNSTLLKEYGYYYNEFDIDGCARQICAAHERHNHIMSSKMARARAYLDTIDPREAESGHVWSQLLANAIPKPLRKRLQDYKVVFICPDHNEKYTKRKTHMFELLTSMGFKDIVHFKSGTENYPICLVHANIDVLTKYMYEPFLLVEDDIEYTQMPTDIDIADDVDAIYVGLSMCAAHPTKNQNIYYAEYTPYSESQVRVQNMLSNHAIFYNSTAYKQAVIRELTANMRVPADITIARMQSKWKVLGMKKAIFYQSNRFNAVSSNGFDVESATKIELGVDGKIHHLPEPPSLVIS